jgi:ABC-type Fe3+-hydroxamate transport system substrate-binding protein
MPQVTDQMGRSVFVPERPVRIVSLVPSQTELLAALGLEEEVVGITRFCVHPDRWFRSKTRVGGTKDAAPDRILALRPDLVIGNREENTRELIGALESRVAVWMSEVESLDDALHMIRAVGHITNREQEGRSLADRIRAAFDGLPDFPAATCAYMIWRDPLMAAGNGTFIDAMLRAGGLENVFADRAGRYPETDLKELAGLNPSLILLSDEPYPFKGRHIREFRDACPHSDVRIVSGEPLSWYGPRLLTTPGFLKGLRERPAEFTGGKA